MDKEFKAAATAFITVIGIVSAVAYFLKDSEWEYRLIGNVFFGIIGVICAVTFFVYVVARLIEAGNSRRAQKEAERKRQRLQKEKWIASRDEFERMAQIALKLQSMVSFEVMLGKQNRIIQVLLERGEQADDE